MLYYKYPKNIKQRRKMLMEEKGIKLSDATKHETKMKPKSDVSDADLENVAGGYWEDAGYAAGFWIECPNCGRSSRNSFNTWADSDQSCDQYRCKCGAAFAVDEWGNVYY